MTFPAGESVSVSNLELNSVKEKYVSNFRYLGIVIDDELSYSAVKLFSKYSNLCDHGT